jgi:hypothetical protein
MTALDLYFNGVCVALVYASNGPLAHKHCYSTLLMVTLLLLLLLLFAVYRWLI